jgi:ParB-like chromosome segregation protein Spo0J
MMMVFQTETPPPEPDAPSTESAPETSDSAGEFMNVPIDQIETGRQVRTDIDPAGESIRVLGETIRERGIIQPLTVSRSGEGYFLVVGERRLHAARLVGMTTVPARVIPTIQSRQEALSLQLIENLQREDLNPIDMAEGIYAYLQSRHGAVPLDEAINQFITFERGPERVSPDVADSLSAIAKFTGKSARSLQRSVAFLALPEEIREALRTGRLLVTQGYLFADHLDNPELLQIFRNLLSAPVTNEKLKMQLEAYAKRRVRYPPKGASPFLGIQASIRSAGLKLADQTKAVTRGDLTKLLESLRAISQQAEARLAALPPEDGQAG